MTPNLENWREEYWKRCEGKDYVKKHLLKADEYEIGKPGHYIESPYELDENKVESFISELLALQKQALKDEAVKRIEELSIRQNHLYADGLDEAKEVIRNI